jgi:ABC-type dipeptide/oligopeptide/nickel transport system permease subunit
VQAAFNRDYTMILGATVFLAVLIVVFNLLSDILAAWMNPRLRSQYGGSDMSAPVITDIAQAEQGHLAVARRVAAPAPQSAGGVWPLPYWVFFVLVALLTPWIAPYGYAQQEPGAGRHAALRSALAGHGYFRSRPAHARSCTAGASRWPSALSPLPLHWSSA